LATCCSAGQIPLISGGESCLIIGTAWLHGLVPIGKGHAPGIATGLGVSGAGGAEPDPRVSASRAEDLPGAAGFFLAAFFLADFSVGFFLADRPLTPARFTLRFVLAALFTAFFVER
jgi:hypothetical protein